MSKEKNTEREQAAKKEMMKKMGAGIGLVAIVVGIIVAVVMTQPEPADPATVINNESAVADPKKGGENATVVVSEYSDFQCPACQSAFPVVQKLVQEYGDKIEFVYNDYPLSQHEYAMQAAISAQCAFEQDAFFPYHDILFERQRSWAQSSSETEAKEAFRLYAEEVSLNMDDYATCIEKDEIVASIEEDMEEGDDLGVTGTPSFFVNGKKVDTNGGYEAGLRAAIDSALNE